MNAVLLDEFDACADAGSIDRLGCAFARFIDSLHPTSPCVLLVSVLLSELESRGDTCLLLDELVEEPCAKLHLSNEECARLTAALGELPSTKIAWKDRLASCRQVFVPGTVDCNQPLVLDQDRLYLRRFWRDECSIAQMVAQRSRGRRPVDVAKLAGLLDQLFPASADHVLDWQKVACAIAVRSDLSIITGGPGTGKTYTVARLLALLFALSPHPEHMRFALAAPSGKAAVRLKQSIDQALDGLRSATGLGIDIERLIQSLPKARTLHSLLGANPETRTVRYHAKHPLDVDVLVVDEASMIDLAMMADLLKALPAHAMVVLLGDKDQLPSVDVGSVMGELCADAERGAYDPETAAYVQHATGQLLPDHVVTGGPSLAQCTTMLRKSERFGGAIGQLAFAVNVNDSATAQQCLRADDHGPVAWYDKARLIDLLKLAAAGRPGAEGGYANYLTLARQRPASGDEAKHVEWLKSVLEAFDKFRVLCAVRQGEWGVEGVNRAIEQRLRDDKLIVGPGVWYVGRPVMVTRNDHALGIFNGDVGLALPDATEQGRLRVYFGSGGKVTSVLPTRLPHIETAFAMTVHKVQGSEFAHTVLALPRELSAIVARELIYTGITRARARFSLVTPSANVFSDGMQRRTTRASGLASLMKSSAIEAA